MKIVSIVGARPEFVQSSPVSRALRAQHHEILVHTGQHYDYQMSQAFFDDLGIPAPDYNLEVGSGSHGKQTAEILVRLEQVLLNEHPDLVIIRGDTNSTLAGALAASKLQIPLAHIEAGERSYNRAMPEEINRLAADALSNIHFCVSQKAMRQLAAEGITTTHWVGDVMFDAMLANLPVARAKSKIISDLNVHSGDFALVTIHRAANTDDPNRLRNIVAALNGVSEKIIFPVHPRTRIKLQEIGATFSKHICVIEPVSYFDMMMLEENARMIATDSGGVQREAYFLKKPCLTLRDETEWTEPVDAGWNKLVGAEPQTIIAAWKNFAPPAQQPPLFGDGTAAQKIVAQLERASINLAKVTQ